MHFTRLLRCWPSGSRGVDRRALSLARRLLLHRVRRLHRDAAGAMGYGRDADWLDLLANALGSSRRWASPTPASASGWSAIERRVGVQRRSVACDGCAPSRPRDRCVRSRTACGRARSTSSSGSSICSRPGKPLRAGDRRRPAAFADPVGSAGHRQDDARAPDRRALPMREFIALSAVMAGVKDIRAAVEQAKEARAMRGQPHGAVPRRGASLQQGAAGHLPAVPRGRHAHLHRRDHGEPFVRSGERVAVARARLRAASSLRPKTSRGC